MMVPSTTPGEAMEASASFPRASPSRSFLATSFVSLPTMGASSNAASRVDGEAGSDVDSGRTALAKSWLRREVREGRETSKGRVEDWVGRGTTGEVVVMDKSASRERVAGSTSCRKKEEASHKFSLELGRLQEDGYEERNGPERSPSRRPPPTTPARRRRTAAIATLAEQTTELPGSRPLRA